MKTIYILFGILLFTSCGGEIKNEDAEIEIEDGTRVSEDDNNEGSIPIDRKRKINQSTSKVENACLGFWVGDFEPDKLDSDQKFEKGIHLNEGFHWNRTNKINISIDKIIDDSVIGHSVVAGNDRPFHGNIISYDERSYKIKVSEPGDDKYDGTFSFSISEGKLSGHWKSFKKIDISNRKYELTRKTYNYNPSVQLTYAKPYANWNKVSSEGYDVVIDDEMDSWIENTYASSTNKIYEINASEKLLKKKNVENLKRGDLQIIRNTIYARHGYSYKSRIYRVFFDAQPWYIPVHTDIKKELTDIEKKNIQLLLRYEKNAEEYYDYFGRG